MREAVKTLNFLVNGEFGGLLNGFKVTKSVEQDQGKQRRDWKVLHPSYEQAQYTVPWCFLCARKFQLSQNCRAGSTACAPSNKNRARANSEVCCIVNMCFFEFLLIKFELHKIFGLKLKGVFQPIWFQKNVISLKGFP